MTTDRFTDTSKGDITYTGSVKRFHLQLRTTAVIDGKEIELIATSEPFEMKPGDGVSFGEIKTCVIEE